jgi:hypothetical protein
MGVVVKQKEFEKATEGVHQVVITEIKDLGLVETSFGTKDRVRIIFECQDQTDIEGQPVQIPLTATKSLHSKSTLGTLLSDLKVPVGAEFDLEDLVGLKAQVIVKHNAGSDGKVYANIKSVF